MSWLSPTVSGERQAGWDTVWPLPRHHMQPQDHTEELPKCRCGSETSAMPLREKQHLGPLTYLVTCSWLSTCGTPAGGPALFRD